MKKVLCAYSLISALTLPLTVGADAFPMYDHQKQCGIAEQHMELYSDEELNDFTTCILAERDAMGNLMNQWRTLDRDKKERCVALSKETGRPDTVSYIVVEQCLTHPPTDSSG
ncbi:hypothetical protein [Vreelandella populi]|uniref:DUF1311 domain-containing protein n=1 Tax=Vreelandella populi TaxID=2498858 RepID=A0A3S0YAE3_9GAMM|nr:hypothetical protein [Halomonas populi]RUR43594.1 hypothetical protein ELY37_18075 [Halomonas populi]